MLTGGTALRPSLHGEISLVIVRFQPSVSMAHANTLEIAPGARSARLLSAVFNNMNRDMQILVRQLRPGLFGLK